MRNDFESNYLMHHGILGQKWGHQNGPPYPLDEGKHSASEKKAGWMKSLSGAIKKHKVKKQRKKALEKAQAVRKQKAEEKKRQDEFAKKKEEILRSGDPKTIMKYRKQLTDNEIQSALNRVRNEQAFNQMIAESQKNGFDKIDSVMKRAGQITDWGKKAKDGYNLVAEVYNAFNAKDESSQLPIIGKDNFFVSKDKDNKKKKYEADKDKINKDWTMKYSKAQSDWKAKADEEDRKWREKMLRAGYKV